MKVFFSQKITLKNTKKSSVKDSQLKKSIKIYLIQSLEQYLTVVKRWLFMLEEQTT